MFNSLKIRLSLKKIKKQYQENELFVSKLLPCLINLEKEWVTNPTLRIYILPKFQKIIKRKSFEIDVFICYYNF